MGATAIVGLLIDAALGGIAVAKAFDEFQQSRPADETPEEAAEAFAKDMIAQVSDEQRADDAIAAWKAKHGSNG